MIMRLLFLTIVLCALIGCAVSPVGEADAAVSFRSNVPYGSKAGEAMDVCKPSAASQTPRHAVIIIHGGSYTGGDKSTYTYLCSKAASLGLVAFNINYRLIKAVSDWPTPLADGQLALRYIRSQATAYNIDPAKVCAFGWSAGANMAAHLAAEGSAVGDVAATLSGYSSRIDCAVVVSGIITPWVGTVFDSSSFISASTKPNYIFAGTNDAKALPSTAQTYVALLTSVGVANRLVVYTGGHIFAGISRTQRAAYEADGLRWILQQ